jgi:CubicO group peptidase (beta-lactamase class C family)
MSKERLDALKDELARRKTRAFLVIRNDKLVYEWYAAGHGPDKKHGAASLSKATVTGLALALLVSDRKLKLDTPAAELVVAWKDDPRKRKIRLRHLGSHTSGLADAELGRLPHDKLTGWQGDFWKRLGPPDDPFTIARDRTPVLFAPGAKLQYSNPGFAVLGYAVTAALKGGPQRDVRSLLRDRVMRPIGVADGEWSVGYGKTCQVDGLPLVAGGAAQVTPHGPWPASAGPCSARATGTAGLSSAGKRFARSLATPACPAIAAWASGPTPAGVTPGCPGTPTTAPGPAISS